ncbi:MAG: hypothetical protein JST69_07705 [Bacteroidetes bacterium]|nr:hypothetical protein [Bacteroidota bacterium]
MKNSLYLLCHAVGYIATIISVLGTPGMMESKKGITKFLFSLADILLPMAWYGIPTLFFISLGSFWLGYALVGKIGSLVSLGLGLGLFLTVLALYLTA